jgi:hypothetical protein
MNRIILFLRKFIALFFPRLFTSLNDAHKSKNEDVIREKGTSLPRLLETLPMNNIQGMSFKETRRENVWKATVESLEDVYLWMDSIQSVGGIKKCYGICTFSFIRQITPTLKLRISNHVSDSNKIAVAKFEEQNVGTVVKILFYTLVKR